MEIVELLGLDSLLAWFILAIGGAMVAGNGFALIQHRRGLTPKGAEGDIRIGRVWWLFGIGLVIVIWAIASLLTA